jgi:hypothetical protein
MIKVFLENLSSVGIAFVLLGIEEALIKPIAKRFIKRKIAKHAPTAMQFLDEIVPGAFSRYNANDLNLQLKQRLESVTGESWGEKEVDQMFTIYDPRITANKSLP